MKEREANLILVVGDTGTADELRDTLVSQGVTHAAVVTQVSALRRSLVLGENDLVVVCIALDESTLERHGEPLRRLLADHNCFPTAVRTVGLLSDLGFTSQVAGMGCDVYVDAKQAARAVTLLNDTWAASEAAPSPRGAAAYGVRTAWMCGTNRMPDALASLMPADRDRSIPIIETRPSRPAPADRRGVARLDDRTDSSGPPGTPHGSPP